MMDIRIFALVAFIAVLGSFTEARSAGYAHGGLRVHRPSAEYATMSRLKREIDGESTTNQATTTPSSTTDTTTPSSTTPSSTTPSSTTPSTEPTTTPTTTTEATSPTTTPTTTSESTTPTTPLTTPTTLSTTSEPSTTTESTTPQPKSDIQSRSNTDEPEDPKKKPEPESPKDDKAPTPGPTPSAPVPNFGGYGPGFGFGGYGPGFDPYFAGYPGLNPATGYGPNYAWTGTNNGPGFASAGASAGSFGYPGMGYPMETFPTVGSPTAFPTFPTYPTYPTFPTYPMGSPSFNSRGGFPETSPNQDNSPKKENSPNQIGYNFGGDPYAGPGFFPGQFPGQFPSFNDPTFDMIKQIQAQIEAQQRAGMAGNYGGGQPQVASASIGLGPYGGFQTGQISPASPGIESRFAEDLPAPSGNSFGVFASSSSSSGTGPDGNQINHKSAFTGVNDNGKISYRTVHD